jgi:hypothetical protein
MPECADYQRRALTVGMIATATPSRFGLSKVWACAHLRRQPYAEV